MHVANVNNVVVILYIIGGGVAGCSPNLPSLYTMSNLVVPAE